MKTRRAAPWRPCRPAPRRGAALLVAMVLLTVVATLASGMVWQQWRAVQVEAAERGRVQNAWMLHGGLDYGRLILREDQLVSERRGEPTHLGSPWATPLEETKVSAMLAMDRDTSADVDLQAFLSGSISDAQSRYNLRLLVADGKLVKPQVEVLQKLCAVASLPTDMAQQLADKLLAAWLGSDGTAPLAPQTLEDLRWLGLDADTIARLAPLVVLLPEATPVNLNTASREVLAAVVPGIDLGGADRLVQARARQPFKSLEEAAKLLGQGVVLPPGVLDVRSMYFEVQGRMRLDDKVLTERFLVHRRPGLEVRAVQRLRSAGFVSDRR